MSTLQARLEQAMKHAKKSKSDLARACDISTAAVAKWFGGTAKNLKMEHLFSVADECHVDARWLATGTGAMIRTKGGTCSHADIPEHRIRLIRMYSALPEEDRAAARRFIELMSWQRHPRKDEYVKAQARKPDMVHED